MRIQKRWLAFHIFYPSPLEEFITRAIKPIIDEINKKGDSEKFFFVRYWEEGAHLRLRFYGTSYNIEKIIKPFVTRKLEEYMENFPPAAPHTSIGENKEKRLHPRSLIVLKDYVPEIKRYGGKNCIEIAEEQFWISSRTVLSIITQNSFWEKSKAIGVAIQLHVTFSLAFGMDLNDIIQFYTFVMNGWLPDTNKAIYLNTTGSMDLTTKKLLHYYKESFEKRKDYLVSVFSIIWKDFHNGKSFEQKWMNEWIAGMIKIRLKLEEKHDLIIPPIRFSKKESIDPKKQILWSILISYVHMTNNRLGILNIDEGYLSYLICQMAIEYKKAYSL